MALSQIDYYSPLVTIATPFDQARFIASIPQDPAIAHPMLMRSPQRKLLITASLLFSAVLGFSKEIDLWFVPMSQEGPQTLGLLAWVKEHFPKDLPKGVTVAGNYGPPIYQDAQQKFIVQGRRGKPDVIEGVLEGMIAYQKAGLITPIDDLYNQWPEKDKFIPSTIKALMINGKLYGVPYNTNVRVLLYRKDILQKYNLQPPKTWEELLDDAATISAKEQGVAGLDLTTKSGSVRTFQEFISFFFQVNGGQNPFKYDEATQKWSINTTPEKLGQVLAFYHDAFFKAMMVLVVLFGSLGAYALSRFSLRGKNLLMMSTLLPQFFPYVLILIPFYVLMSNLGLVDTHIGLILTHTSITLPFAIWMLTGYFNAIPKELDQAALIDGCSRLGVLFRIIYPTALPGLVVAGFFAFVVSWGDYLFVSILSQSENTQTLPIALQSFMNSLQVKWGMIIAGTVVAILPTILFFSLVQRRLVAGLTAGAIKN
jgi:ABC-type glycerol-3-phosphate transport system permease component